MSRGYGDSYNSMNGATRGNSRPDDIKRFLDHLLQQRASASSHLQAICAIRFLYMIYTHALNRGPFAVRSPLD